MITYTKPELLSLLTYLEENRANLGAIDGKQYRPLVKALMQSSSRSYGAMMLEMLEVDEGSYVFLCMVPLTELPLYISNSPYAILAKWRLGIVK